MSKQRVVCAGTFDFLHTGHVQYMKAAKALVENSELIVIVGRDDISTHIKGKIPFHNQETRLKRISAFDFVDRAVLGFEKDRVIERVASLNPDIVALGHDQWAREVWLFEGLKKKGLNVKIVRMPMFEKEPLLIENSDPYPVY